MPGATVELIPLPTKSAVVSSPSLAKENVLSTATTPTADMCAIDPRLGRFHLELLTDDHSVQTTWVLLNSATEEQVLSGPEDG